MHTQFGGRGVGGVRLVAAGVLLFFGLWMNISAAEAVSYAGVRVRVETPTSTTFDQTVYISDQGCTVKDGNGVEYAVSGAAALCALDAASQAGGFTYNLDYYTGFGFLVQGVGAQMADASNYWLYYVNVESPSVGMADYVVEDGDELLLSYGGFNPPLRLSLSAAHRRTGGAVEIRVENYAYDYLTSTGTYAAVPGVTVTIDDSAAEQTVMTDASGVAVFTPSATGMYTVQASADGYTRSASANVNVYKRFEELKNIGRVKRAATAADGADYLMGRVDENGLVDGSIGVTEWSVMGLAAAGTSNKKLAAAVRAYHPMASSGALEVARHIMALEALGDDARNVDGMDVVAELATTLVDGQFGDSALCNDDIFSVLALLAADEPVSSELVRSGVVATLACVNEDGGVSYVTGGSSDVDTTAAWLMMAGRLKGKDAQLGVELREVRRAALVYVRAAQRPDGGWGYNASASSNSSSTAWVLQGLRAQGHEASAMTTNFRNGFHFLQSARDDDGSMQYDAIGSQSLQSLNTAYALMAFNKRPLPVNKKAKLQKDKLQ